MYLPWPNVQRARFKNFPLACSYRAQIRFVARRICVELDAHPATMQRNGRSWPWSRSIETNTSFEMRTFAILSPRSQFSKTLVDVSYDFIRGGWTIIVSLPGILTGAALLTVTATL